MEIYNSTTIIVLALMISTAFGMDDNNNHCDVKSENPLPTISIEDRNPFLFIGLSKTRKKIEKSLKQEFLLNEPFVAVRYRNCSQQLPYIPYKILKNFKNGDIFSYEINGEIRMFLVQQRYEDPVSFQDKLVQGFEKFKENPFYLKEGEESLFKAHIIQSVPINDRFPDLARAAHGPHSHVRRWSH